MNNPKHTIDPTALAHLSGEAAGLAVGSASNPDERAELAGAVDAELAEQDLGVYDKRVHSGPLSLEGLVAAVHESRLDRLLATDFVSKTLPSNARERVASVLLLRIDRLKANQREGLLRLWGVRHPDDPEGPKLDDDEILARILMVSRPRPGK